MTSHGCPSLIGHWRVIHINWTVVWFNDFCKRRNTTMKRVDKSKEYVRPIWFLLLCIHHWKKNAFSILVNCKNIEDIRRQKSIYIDVNNIHKQFESSALARFNLQKHRVYVNRASPYFWGSIQHLIYEFTNMPRTLSDLYHYHWSNLHPYNQPHWVRGLQSSEQIFTNPGFRLVFIIPSVALTSRYDLWSSKCESSVSSNLCLFDRSTSLIMYFCMTFLYLVQLI